MTIRYSLTALIISLLLCHPAGAQNYPARTIHFYIGSAPGGPIDLVARPVGQKLTELLGQQVVVDFKPGADGIIGTDFVAKSVPDGHTLLVVGTALTINPAIKRSLPYDTLKDFTLITLLANSDSVLVVNPKVPVNTVPELIALARARPGKLNYGSTGATSRLGMELFLMMAGINIAHIPYKGAGPAIVDLLGGQIDLMFTSVPPSFPHVKAGRLRLLAVGGLKRAPNLPDTPTVNESLPKFENTSQYGLVAPAATPRAVINLLNGALRKVLAMPEVKDAYAANGLEPNWQTPEEAAAWVRAEMAKWAAVAKAAKIEPE